MSVLRALAPAKINLGLFVGPTRASDARHELVTVMQSISLADELTLEAAPAGAQHDEVICPGVPGPPAQNLAATALRAFRAHTGWNAPPQRLSILKRIPVAAGLAGGSADAAATLRLARHASALGNDALLRELGAQLGADVPAQITPGRWLATGAGEQLLELPSPARPLGVLVLPSAAALATAAVYAEADRLGPARSMQELELLQARLLQALGDGAPLAEDPELLHNDLQRAALSLCPEIASTLAQVGTVAGAGTLLSGSGPTVLALFAAADASAPDGHELAQTAARALPAHVPAPLCARSVDADFGRVRHNP